jgi:hypothetical protein
MHAAVQELDLHAIALRFVRLVCVLHISKRFDISWFVRRHHNKSSLFLETVAIGMRWESSLLWSCFCF